MFGLARFVYRPTQTNSTSTGGSMQAYIELEQFMSDAITITDTAKSNSKHPELQQFAADSTYSWAFNREGVRIIQEDLGIRQKHGDGKHCDSVGC